MPAARPSRTARRLAADDHVRGRRQRERRVSRRASPSPRAALLAQPAVIDGKLQHPVDPEAFDWHLDGKGDERTLVIDLEKVSGGIDWYDLLQVGNAGQVV